MNNREMRSYAFEVRAEQNEKHGHFITGTPIVFNQETQLRWFRESIAPEALANTDMKDVRFCVGHKTDDIPLARSRNNNANSTMQMKVAQHGMDIRVDLDTENNAQSRALYSATERGDISGMSFAFTVDGEEWQDLESDNPLRIIRSIKRIFEVSAVAFPAYEGTSLEARADGASLDSERAALESARQKLKEERAEKEKAERRRALLAELKGETNE